MGAFDSITTGRLLLRRWREADREPFAELNVDPQTLVFFPATLSRAKSDALIDLDARSGRFNRCGSACQRHRRRA